MAVAKSDVRLLDMGLFFEPFVPLHGYLLIDTMHRKFGAVKR